MKNYERPVANEIKLALCNLILTSEEEAPDLGTVSGGKSTWLDAWNSIGG